MEGIEDIAEGNHDGGDAAGNIDQSQKVGLEEMPVEILEHILVHLDDKSLLKASHVCTLFASVAETAFAQKYSNKSYKIRGWLGHNMVFHEVMLSKYGDKIRKIDIGVEAKDVRLLDLAERVCCNLSSLALYSSPKMILSTGLKEVHLANLDNLNRASFIELIHQNQQLEILVLSDQQVDLFDVLDGLSNLKTLKYTCRFGFTTDLPTIRLSALETLKLDLSNDDYVHVLHAITCNELKLMSLVDESGFNDLTDGVVDQICSFKTLVSLQLSRFRVTEDQLKSLARRLPHLTELGIGETENVENEVQLAVRILPNLTKLTIALDDEDYDELFDDLMESMQDFRARFVVNDVKIKLVCGVLTMSISKDGTFAFYENTLKMFWTQNWNEVKLRKVLDEAVLDYLPIIALEIINDCVDATLDISEMMLEHFESAFTIDIKSKWPITVNANATRLPTFFPDLRKLKIQLENHSVVDLLQNLDEKFCKQIKELSIDTKNVQNDNDQEMEHGNDITDILAKFKNLKSLHVATSDINFDAKHLQSVCPNLNKLCVQRHSNQ